MKIIATAVTATCLLAASPSFAALSGYWDSSKVIHAILGNAKVADALKQQPIDSVTATTDGYRVASRNCHVDVRVQRTEPSRPAPAQFTLNIGRGQCR